MELKTCKYGHKYHATLKECPECANLAGHTVPVSDIPLEGRTVGNFGAFGGFGPADTVPVHQDTIPVNPQPGKWAQESNYKAAGGVVEDYGATMAVEVAGRRPVTGWLVCIDGPEKGKDYRLHADYNYIGRSSEMDVCIDDITVSRKNHAIIAHDARDNVFYFAPATGATMVRHNGKIVLNNVELKRGDRIEIGKGKFLFVPLCGEDFQW